MAMGDDLRTRASSGTWFQLMPASAVGSLACLALPLLSALVCCKQLPESSDGVLLGVLRSSAEEPRNDKRINGRPA